MVDYDDYDNNYNYKSDEGKIKKDFMKYADPKTKQIKFEGMEKMGKVLNIDIYTDIFITYFFYKCGCKSMDGVTEQEYVKGLKNCYVNSLDELVPKIICYHLLIYFICLTFLIK